MKLTEEQKIIVAENHNLIYWIINSKHLELSEYYDILAIELCYAVAKYDPIRGSLANYYKLRCDGILYKEYRKSQAQKRIHTSVTLIDNVHTVNNDDLQRMAELSEWMSGDDGIILQMKSEGYNQSEIANHLGVSQSYVSKILKRLKKEFYEDEEE